MKVTYLDYCGYMIVTNKAILVFDYYRDPSHSLHKALEAYPDFPVVFFMSHRNHDRTYRPEIYEIAQNHNRLYVMANDIPADQIPSTLDVAGMSPGDIIEDLPGIKSVKAYRSTGRGVTFVVTVADGRKIFHGGNIGEPEGGKKKEADSASERRADEEFRTVIGQIAAGDPEVYVGMFPLYKTEGREFTGYAKYYLEKVKTENYFPMNIGDSFAEGCDFDAYVQTPGAHCHCLHNPGTSVKLG